MEDAERRRLIHDVLQQSSRDLGSARTQRLVDASQTSNPLYLRVLLDELRVFGSHKRLNERIDWYLEARDPYALYRKVIARWEDAYADGSALVRDTLSLLWAARRGLSESELLEALGPPGRPLPRAVWSPLFLAMSDALVSRSGLLTFAHDFLRTAAREACLPDASDQGTAHRRLASYFQREPSWTNRRLDELPWQLAAAREWQSLHDALTEEPCFRGLRHRDAYELLGYWLQLTPRFDLASSYTTAFARWEQRHEVDSHLGAVANELAIFLNTAACYAAAEPLLRRALAIAEASYGAEHPTVAIALNNLAQLLKATNRLAEAEPLLRRALALDEANYGTEHPDVARHLNNLAGLLQATNRLAEAEPLMRRALAIDEASYGAEHPTVATRLNNLAGLLQATKRLAEAEPLLRRALALDEASYGAEHPTVATHLNNLAGLLKDTNRLAEAEPLMRRTLAIDEASYGAEHPTVATDLNNLAALLQATNRLAEAEPLMRRALALDEASYGAEHPKVATALNNLAALLQATDRLAEAEPLMRRALAIDEASYGAEHPTVAKRLNNLAALLQATNRLAEAEPLMRRMVEIFVKFTRATGHPHPHLQVATNNYAALLQAMGRGREEIMATLRRMDPELFGG